MRKPRSKKSRMQSKHSELQEVELLKSWIESQQPKRGSNPIDLSPLFPRTPALAASTPQDFRATPASSGLTSCPSLRRPKNALHQSKKYVQMSDIQRVCLPHALCGRDVRGAAKTGSRKTLAFVIPIVENLYRERWCPQDGVGSIIISPTREIASQTFDVLRLVGRHHSFSAALLIGGRRGKDVEAEKELKELVNECNILVYTPGRLLQHMDETPNFDDSQLQVFVLDQVDSMLSDPSFKQTMNAIISQLPKQRQTLLFSATHLKDVKDLAALCLKGPEFQPNICHCFSSPKVRRVVEVHKKKNLKSRVLVFLSTRKQVSRPVLDQHKRMATVSEFSKQPSVLFSTDVASRGLDFNQGVDWVVQVDCPGDVASYIHRVGRTARYDSVGKSLLFLMPSEEKMLEKLQAAKIPIREIKPNKNVVQSVSGKLADSIVQDPDLHGLAQSAFKTYLKSVDKKDKENFDVTKLPIDEFSASIGLASTPRIRFLNNKIKSSSKKVSELSPTVEPEHLDKDNELELLRKEELDLGYSSDEEGDKDPLLTNDIAHAADGEGRKMNIFCKFLAYYLKINIHRPVGTRVVFDEEGNTLPPLARLADTNNDSGLLNQIQGMHFRRKLREDLKKVDKDDKVPYRHCCREKRLKDKIKSKRGNTDEQEEDDVSDSEGEPNKKLLLSNC
ncbi:DEAD-box ATP-dependent RNA helicase 32-like [Pyrus ussuriensis x Pyrus communis]|uniref:ATP-dependent RNA helicase n=1 Tax=Pyrus ussuriensis x Pyrus communis TaxID=2448454 RepID=A0A5N5FNK7_9ROSA|nr:DEAD-box ATP-dependent RNA helicase 32-like [Pyrus ussuriensis x Pyrus communis]